MRPAIARWFRSLAVLAAVVAALAPAAAHAHDRWTTPHPGIKRLHRTTSSPTWNINAVVVDLDTPGVRLAATPVSHKKRTTSSFARAIGANVAINGDFFLYSNYNTVGLAVGGARAWPGTADGTGHGTIQFDRAGRRVEITHPATVVRPASWMEGVVGGNVTLVAGGQIPGFGGSFCETRHPRTAVGLTQNGRKLILAVVDGRQRASVGMTCAELARLMKELGSHESLNLDGGGSSTMYVSGTGVVNRPSDGRERVVANHLAIFAGRPTAPPPAPQPQPQPQPQPGTGKLTGVIYKNPSTANRLAGATVKLSNGATAKTDAHGLYEFDVAAGTYTITATLAGYTTASLSRKAEAGRTVWGSMGLSPAVQPGTLIGAVYRGSDTSARIANATVKLSNGASVRTDASGVYRFNVAPGTYTATATATGYASASVTRQVESGKTIWGSMGLAPSAGRNGIVETAPVDVDPADDPELVDADGDLVDDANDNCPNLGNVTQADADDDGVGDACQGDDDGDGVENESDNCPSFANSDQADADQDGAGDACSEHVEGDWNDAASGGCASTSVGMFALLGLVALARRRRAA